MSREEAKAAAARAALDYVEAGTIVGVGTGSTANRFIELLARGAPRVEAAVASSEATAGRLREQGIRVIDLPEVERLALYVDGADEATRERALIKGGGGALTREKIVAAASARFVCIVDGSKLVERLGRFPVAIEVIPMARTLVAREVELLGGRPVLRAGFTTDNGNRILDVHGLDLTDGAAVESRLDGIPGVVACGLFCRRPADLLIVAGAEGVAKFGSGT
jgi:ribose 5-phosphate isomerase A